VKGSLCGFVDRREATYLTTIAKPTQARVPVLLKTHLIKCARKEPFSLAKRKTARTRLAAAPKLHPIGVIRSSIKERSKAPMQGSEGAPDAWLEINPSAMPAIDGLAAGHEIIVITWLHAAKRDVLKVHPRSDPTRALTGVFATRSPDRPNPLGLHRVTIRKVSGRRLRIGPIEAIDGTPGVDIKPVRQSVQDS
jgi:tRNA-Thr(GGU) m(6)t(6)A37 methyltransferase TsaA